MRSFEEACDIFDDLHPVAKVCAAVAGFLLAGLMMMLALDTPS